MEPHSDEQGQSPINPEQLPLFEQRKKDQDNGTAIRRVTFRDVKPDVHELSEIEFYTANESFSDDQDSDSSDSDDSQNEIEETKEQMITRLSDK